MRNFSVLAAALLLAPAITQAATLEDLLVEKGVITKGEAAGMMGGSSKVYYKGGTRLEFPDTGFTMKIQTTIQERYTYTDGDAGEGNSSSFNSNKVRLAISGTALNEEFSYYLKGDFYGASSDSGTTANLADAYITWHACDWAWVRMGQWKTGISRQYVNGDETLQFADRSLASDFFDLGRQHGAQIGGNFGEVSLAAGIYNGSSDGEGQNRPGVDTKHTGVLNARYNLGEIDPKVEGDVDNSSEFAATFGAAYAYAEDEVGGADSQKAHTINIDTMMKIQGFSLAAEYYYRSIKDVGGADGVDLGDNGFYVQAGYFVIPEELELAARYSLISFDGSSDDDRGIDDINEFAASVNYYWWKHQLKGSLGWVNTSENPEGDDDTIRTNKWLVQLSSWF